MSNNLRVGQKVVHVPYLGGKYNYREIYNDVTWPEINGVYTIGGLYPGSNGEIGVTLVELGHQCTYKHPPMRGQRVGFRFHPYEFRPLSFLDIDISIFTKMLTPTDELVT